jgi:hypothetical protein
MSRRPSKDDDEQDEQEPEPIPAEAKGSDLTALRARQAFSRRAAEKLWNEITQNIQKAQHEHD